MTTHLPHLRLQKVEVDLPRKKKRGFSGKERSQDERRDIGDKILSEKDAIIKEFAKWRTDYGDKIEPALIFRIDTTAPVDKKSIENMGLKVLSVEGKNAIVVFSSDDHLSSFTKKMKQYAAKEGHTYAFIDAFEGLSEYAVDEKIGRRLEENPLSVGETEILDIEFWPYEKGQLLQWKRDVERILIEEGGSILDEYMGKSFYVIRAKVPYVVFDEITNLRQVSFVDRPPKLKLQVEKIRSYSVKNAKILPPDENSVGMLIIDSGIMPSHPLLEEATSEHESFIDGKDSIDEAGHGTNVAGVAIYGDLQECINQNEFEPDAWLYSARVCDEKGDFDPERLLEHQLRDAIDYFLENYPTVKIVNLSIGDTTHVIEAGMKQFRLAALIDEVIYEYRVEKSRDVIFVISAGNCFDILYSDPDLMGDYPHYLLDDDGFTLIDPGTAANALTVGSISPGLDSAYTNNHKVVGQYRGFPSPFTRTGPGLNGMVKPELVEIGGDMVYQNARGGLQDPSIGVVVTEKNYTTDGLFSIDNGTSFAAPKVANAIARIWNHNPTFSSELIKALIINSAEIPKTQSTTAQLFHHGFERPKRLEDIKDARNIYGYGIPNIEHAMFSDANRVLLFDETQVGLDKTVFYELPVPTEFYDESGDREISITLSYTPPTKRTRGDSYIGCTMEFNLFRGIDFETLKTAYSKLEESLDNGISDEETVPTPIQKYKISMDLGVQKRATSTVQKATWLIKRTPQTTDNTLKLVVICKDKWISDDNYKQQYAVIATVKHTKQIELYNQIQQRVQLRERERIRV